MKMLDFYIKTIYFGDLVADNQGMVSHQIPGTERNSALTITAKRVVLPTTEHLANPDWSNRMAFHPLVENQIGNESLIHERLRRAVNQAINMRFSYLLVAIARICKSEFVDKRNSIGVKYSEIWAQTSKADDKFYQNVVKLIDAEPVFVHTLIHRGLQVGVQQYRVGCDVFFPLLEDLNATTDREVKGVKFRVSDIETLKNLYELILPGSSVKNAYTTGSDSTYSPSLFAQLAAIDKIYSRLNYFFENFDEITEEKDLYRDTSWINGALLAPKELHDEAQQHGLLEGNGSKPKKNQTAHGPMIEVNNTVVTKPIAQMTPTMVNNPVNTGYVSLGAPVQHRPPAAPPVSNAPAYGAPPMIGMQQPQLAPVAQNNQVTTQGNNMNHHKIGLDSSQINPATRTSANTTFNVPRQLPVEHTAQQQNMMIMQTPQGPVAVQSMSMSEAAQLAQQQAQAQQQQQQMMLVVQQKAMIAQANGYRVFQNSTGSYSVEVADGKGGSIYQPIEQWEPPMQQAGQPAVGAPVNVMPQAMMPGQQPMMVNPQAAVAATGPGGSVSINDWIRTNPMAAANFQNQQQQQQLQMMMQMYGGMNPAMMTGMNPAMMAAMNPAMMNGMAANAAYVPSHVRAAAMMPAGMILPVGGR